MKRYKQNEINLIINAICDNKVLSVPTDTVYGICARVHSPEAFNKLVEVKNRPSNKKFPVMCSDIEQIKSIAIVDDKAERLIRAFMPGPITLVLRKRADVFTYINNGGTKETDELAIRMAPSIFLKQVINGVGSPLFMTSANQSGQEICKALDDIERTCPALDGMVEGEVSLGQASTIVDCTGDTIKIQRRGPISEEEIMRILK